MAARRRRSVTRGRHGHGTEAVNFAADTLPAVPSDRDYEEVDFQECTNTWSNNRGTAPMWRLSTRSLDVYDERRRR